MFVFLKKSHNNIYKQGWGAKQIIIQCYREYIYWYYYLESMCVLISIVEYMYRLSLSDFTTWYKGTEIQVHQKKCTMKIIETLLVIVTY